MNGETVNTMFDWEKLKELRQNGKVIKSNWNGQFYETVYELDGIQYMYTEDMDNGIPYSIDKLESTAKVR